MGGINASTLDPLDGYDHVLQSLGKILYTPQGARVMREWFGNPGLRLLGENMTDETILLWFNTIYMLIELFEPRLKVISFEVPALDPLGFAEFIINAEYRPYAHLEWKQASFFVSIDDKTVSLRSAA